MSTVTRTAGVAGSFPVLLDTVPIAPPTVTAWTDAARTLNPVVLTVTATADPAVFTATYPASLDAGTYYLTVDIPLAGRTDRDRDDTLVLTVTASTVQESLVSVEVYRDVTGDSSTPEATVAARLLRAQRKVETFLRRPLPLLQRTERLRLRHSPGYGVFGGGWTAYPAATPVLSAVGLSVQGNAVVGASGAWLSWWDDGDQYADVTYTGGWSAATLPEPIVEAICRTAQAAGQTAAVPAGATSVRNGDVAVTFAAGAAGAQLDPAVTSALRPYVRRRL